MVPCGGLLLGSGATLGLALSRRTGRPADNHSLRRRCRSVCGGRCREQERAVPAGREADRRDGVPARRTEKGLTRAVAGEGPARESLEALSRQLGLSDCTVFAGARRDIPRILPLLDLFVLPSLYEGFGIAILEAMAAGKPVVATAVGGIPEFVVPGETGLLVEAGNAAALADAIGSLLRDPERARQMGIRGRARVLAAFQMSTVVRRHEQVYEACLAHAYGG